jgi:hypothetical protein
MTMKRTLPLIALLLAGVLVVLLIASAGARAPRGGAGHNPPTRKLEAAFKFALYERSISKDGCYPPPPRLAKLIAGQSSLKMGVARNPNSGVARSNVVYILRSGSSCNKVGMALRSSSGLYVLDSAQGTIRVAGRRGFRTNPGKSGPPRGLRIVEETFKMTEPEEQDRFEVFCPGKTYPLGGGLISHQLPAPDGEAMYPHSYERLGAQRGFHVSFLLFDASPQSTAPRAVTLQAVCANGLIPANPSPHKTIFIKSGEIRSAVARCPRGQYLVTGGFQRTNFGADGGNYITESRAVGPRAWKVSGSAFPLGGGELTAIAYCVRHKGPILTEVSGSAAVPAGQSGTATTDPCPSDLRLTTTGFSTNGSRNAFFVASSLNENGTSSTSAFGHFGTANVTAYGYCLRARG